MAKKDTNSRDEQTLSREPDAHADHAAAASPLKGKGKAAPRRAPARQAERPTREAVSPAAQSIGTAGSSHDGAASGPKPQPAGAGSSYDAAASGAKLEPAGARSSCDGVEPPPMPGSSGTPCDESPVTRRSSPLPAAMATSNVRIPPLPRVTVGQAPPVGAAGPHAPREVIPGYDLDGETTADVAPVGPTEARAAAASGPEGDPPPFVDPPRQATTVELEQQIRDLEARLDDMMRGGRARPNEPAPAVARDQTAAEPPAARPAAPLDDAPEEASTARELFATDYYLRQWGRAGMRSRTEEVDEFGLDPAYVERFRPLFDFLYTRYFRIDTEGAHRIPNEGRCLIVSNHSGGPLPYDGPMLRTAVRREHPKHRELRWLAEDFIYYLPFVGAAMNRLGAVRACQENAERLFAQERAVAVFPEGAKGIGKLYRDRYRLQRFGRGGFIRLCLRTGTPIVPCAIVGAEESSPMLYRIEYMTKALGIPYVPITPTFPALGPLGLLPAPTKWKIRFGELVRFEEYGPEAADDDILVGRLADRVRTTIQAMLDRTVAERRSIWFG